MTTHGRRAIRSLISKRIIKVDLRQDHGLHAVIELPDGVEATVLFPVAAGNAHLLINEMPSSGTPAGANESPPQ
jgi:hypothetical protein